MLINMLIVPEPAFPNYYNIYIDRFSEWSIYIDYIFLI